MRKFKTIDEVDAWLKPMDYQGFWVAIAPHDLVLQPRGSCDRQIASGEVDQAIVLDGLKYLARIELTERHGLHWREVTPWLKLVETH